MSGHLVILLLCTIGKTIIRITMRILIASSVLLKPGFILARSIVYGTIL